MATTTSPSPWDPTPNPSSAAPGSASGSSAAKSSSPCPPTHPPRSSAPATTPPSRAASPSASAQVRSFVRSCLAIPSPFPPPPINFFLSPLPVLICLSLIYLTETFPAPGGKNSRREVHRQSLQRRPHGQGVLLRYLAGRHGHVLRVRAQGL